MSQHPAQQSNESSITHRVIDRKHTRSRKRNVLCALLLLLPLCFVLAIVLGTVNIPVGEALTALLVTPFTDSANKLGQTDLVIQQIRLPRAALATLIGALLGICGATTQGLFRNPLADPSLIGVTAGASAGAALTIFFASSLAHMNTIMNSVVGIGLISAGAFVGGSLAVILVYRIASNRHGTSVATMLLAGIAITAIAGSLSSLLKFFSTNEMLRHISLWSMGGLDGANYQRVLLAAIFAVIIVVVLPRFASALNALLLGESEARHLGLSVQKIKYRLIVIVAAGVGVSVALAGTIAFIGLIVPHIIRLAIGPDHRFLLPASALGGAVLLLLSDTVARTLFAPIELPVGLVTALLGAPFFISLLRHRHNFEMR